MDSVITSPGARLWQTRRQNRLRSVLLAMSCALAAPAATGQAEVNEGALKAAFVYNFVQFTDWPVDALPATPTLVLCVSPDDALRSAMEALDGRPVGKRVLRVQDTPSDPGSHRCQLLLSNDAVLNDSSGDATLTISGSANGGAIITLVEADEQIHFDVNNSAAAQRRLHLSSRLLALARRLK